MGHAVVFNGPMVSSLLRSTLQCPKSWEEVSGEVLPGVTHRFIGEENPRRLPSMKNSGLSGGPEVNEKTLVITQKNFQQRPSR